MERFRFAFLQQSSGSRDKLSKHTNVPLSPDNHNADDGPASALGLFRVEDEARPAAILNDPLLPASFLAHRRPLNDQKLAFLLGKDAARNPLETVE
jgi:hypothetical protein